MADTKISAMAAASALDGTETLPLVQSGANVKGTVQNLANFMPIYTWATLPDPTTNSGLKIRVSDIGVSGSEWYSNGTTWEPVGGRIILSKTQTQVTVTGTTSETVLATITIPAGVMGATGQLWVAPHVTTTGQVASAKSYRVRFGGAAGTTFYEFTTSAANPTCFSNLTRIFNRTAGAQFGPSVTLASFGSGTGANVSASVNTAAATSVVVSIQPAAAGESYTLESCLVELVR